MQLLKVDEKNLWNLVSVFSNKRDAQVRIVKSEQIQGIYATCYKQNGYWQKI